jgi:hypothetical protein
LAAKDWGDKGIEGTKQFFAKPQLNFGLIFLLNVGISVVFLLFVIF